MKTAATKSKDGPNEFQGLVGEKALMEIIWPDSCSRPSVRWFQSLKADGVIPFVRIGRRVFYDPVEVRLAFNRFKVNPPVFEEQK